MPCSITSPGTLLWIGPRRRVEVQRLSTVAEHVCPQVAYRSDLQDAVDRPAASVRLVMIVKSKSGEMDAATLSTIADVYPSAQRWIVNTSLCQTVPSARRDPNTVPMSWRIAADRLQEYWTSPATEANPMVAKAAKDTIGTGLNRPAAVLVLADRLATADHWMDLVAADGHSVCWANNVESTSVRNIDLCLWDDSLAAPTDVATWRTRIRQAGRCTRSSARHAWMTVLATPQQIQSARDAGVDTVIAKPGPVAAVQRLLRNMVGVPPTQSNPQASPRRAA
ncbi:hypothetical protein [Crateriforma conspicua]|uniref:Uncharacterized protein n=1 Tax=Crateriforma conspicua TaxID=2527996 RepID=A0A5C5Y603_9PLAN|nr:hypothetical protein [Crateriforma conspicua]TWT70143.1 hypothetical protein Pan14r_24430 [Crateriforma conspicua]